MPEVFTRPLADLSLLGSFRRASFLAFGRLYAGTYYSIAAEQAQLKTTS
jgi:hypothetical protein